MQYIDGTEVRVGDRVTVWRGTEGDVVCSIDGSEYTPDYPRSAWGYLGAGVLVMTAAHGLIHLREASEDLELVARKRTGPR